MASPVFLAAMQQASVAINAVHGEAFTLTPMAEAGDVNAPPVADTVRAAFLGASLTGVFMDPPAKPIMVDAFDPRTDLRPGTITGTPRVDFMPGALPVGLSLRRGDLLRQTATGIIRRISSVFVTKALVTRCEVNLVGTS